MQHDYSAVMKKKRQLRDPEVDAYLRTKARIIDLVKQARKEGVKIDDEKLDEAQADLDNVAYRIALSLKMDALTEKRVEKEYEEFDGKIGGKIMKMIDKEVELGKQLDERIAKTQDLLTRRLELNEVIESVYNEAKSIQMERAEVEELFGEEGIDIEVLLKDAQVVERDGVAMYQFNAASKPSFDASCEELQKQIHDRLERCEQLKKETAETQQEWQQLSDRVMAALSPLQDLM